MSSPVKTKPLLPLEPGDQLTRDEFERRYRAMPNVKKAELIEGVVHMPSPVSWQSHGCPHVSLAGLLGYYKAFTPGVDAGDNATVRLDQHNVPQPDVTLIIREECGGRARISADDYLEGAPELVAEVAASSLNIDVNAKLRVYQRNGIAEYILRRVEEEKLDWFILASGAYQRLVPDTDGVFRSRIFPGLWIDFPALLRDDGTAGFSTLARGLASPEHAAFVQHLAAHRNA